MLARAQRIIRKHAISARDLKPLHTRRYQLGYFDPILAAYVPRPPALKLTDPASVPNDTCYLNTAYTLSV